MGTILQAKCTNCYYREKFLLGAGMLDNKIDIVLKRFSSEEKTKISAWMEVHNLKTFQSEIIFTFCDDCNTYKATPILQLRSASDETQQFGHSCNECGHTLTIVDPLSKFEDSRCMLCGETLDYLEIGHWD